MLLAALAALLAVLLCGSALADTFQLPENTQVIEQEAFRNCINLTGTLTIPEGVTEIGDYAFAGCSGLTGLPVIPDTVQIIGAHAFDGCSGLTGLLYIPASVSVEDTAFSDCPNLTVTRSAVRVALVGSTANPTEGDLDAVVQRAVSAFCAANDLPFQYYNNNVGQAVQDGCNAVVTVGWSVDGVGEAQRDNPDVRFIVLDTTVDEDGIEQGDNTFCALYDARQAGYLAGYAAVKMGYRKLGFIGGFEFVNDVVEYGQGFVKGASDAAAALGVTDQVSVAYTYANTFAPDQKVRVKAEYWYDQGVEVIFCCGGGLCGAVAEAAGEGTGRMIIGVDTDQAGLLEGRVLTSAMKNLGFSAIDALEHILNGTWNEIGGKALRQGVVSADPARNHVGLPQSTMNGFYSSDDYANLLNKLSKGTLSVSGNPAIDTYDTYSVAVIGGEANPWGQTLDADINRAVSAFCADNGMDYQYYQNDEENDLFAIPDALEDGRDVFIGIGSMENAAAENPDKIFINLDNREEEPHGNSYSVSYKTDEAGYLAGYAAVKLGYRKLGFMGGISVPDVVNYGQGFVKGASDAAAELNVTDDVTVIYAYSGVFWPDNGVRTMAEDWYDQGVEVIFCCGGSLCYSVVDAAGNDSARKIIGVDTDQSELLSGNRVVTSAVKDVGHSAVDALAHIAAGTWKQIGGTSPQLGIVSSDPADNHVGLTSIQYNSGFSAADYATLVSRLRSGALSVSGEALIEVEDQTPEGPEEIVVSSRQELLDLGSPLTGIVIVKSTDNGQIDLDWPLEVEGELYVEVDEPEQGMAFSSLRIQQGGSLTLLAGSVLGTHSIMDANFVPRGVAQVWLNGGTLDASQGTVEDYSSLFVVSGTYNLPPQHGFYVIASAMDEAALRACLSDEGINEVFVQANITLTADLDVYKSVQVQSNSILTVGNGCTLTVKPGGNLSADAGSSIVGNVVYENAGE